MCLDPSMCIDWSVVANIAVAICTGILALLTWKLAAATVKMAKESQESSIKACSNSAENPLYFSMLHKTGNSCNVLIYRQKWHPLKQAL